MKLQTFLPDKSQGLVLREDICSSNQESHFGGVSKGCLKEGVFVHLTSGEKSLQHMDRHLNAQNIGCVFPEFRCEPQPG